MDIEIEVTRAFCIKGERQEVGKVLTVPFHVFVELETCGKAIRNVSDDKPEAAPVKAKAKKGATNESV